MKKFVGFTLPEIERGYFLCFSPAFRPHLLDRWASASQVFGARADHRAVKLAKTYEIVCF